MKEHFEINIENLSNEEKADVLYYNIFLAIVSELKLDKYFVDSDNYKNGEDIQGLIGMSFRMTLDEKTIRDVVVLRSPMDIWTNLQIYCAVKESKNIPMIILIDELLQEFSANNLTYNEEVVKQFYRTFKNYIMSKAEDLDVKGREVQKYSEKLKNVDLSIDWERVDYLFFDVGAE